MKPTLLAVTLLGLALSACSSAPQKQETAKPAETEPAKPAPVVVNPAPAPAASEASALDKIIQTMASNSIYFDFDKSDIKPEYMDTIKHDFELLKAHPQVSVRLEGNCDERGSAEYNIALGQRRADAVRRALVTLGIEEARLDTVSYGKEHPTCMQHDESCWSKNRRVDFARK